jgi:O-antigen/teichoic acid export membrane protein
MLRWRSITNAFANVCRGSANALVMVLLPYFLTRQLSKDVYGTWFLILQIASYISYLDFGVQTAVGRFVAYYNELEDFQQRDKVVSTSIAILSGMSILGIGILLLVSQNLHHLFRAMPAVLESDAKISLLVLGISLAIALPFSVFGALFVGIQRYDVPAWIIGVGRILGGVAVVFASHRDSNQLIAMTVAMGIFNIASGVCQYVAYRRMLPPMKLALTNISTNATRDVFKHCSPLVIWTLGIVLVTQIDPLIIGYFDYKSLPYYSLASILISFIVGIQGSVFSTILPGAAAIGARQDGVLLGNLLLSATRYSVGILVLTSVPLLICGYAIMIVWTSKEYADNSILLLYLLLAANFIRQLGGPYAMIVMAV